jgi:photosystem II stability/assembly factor-like uncharacterized protein
MRKNALAALCMNAWCIAAMSLCLNQVEAQQKGATSSGISSGTSSATISGISSVTSSRINTGIGSGFNSADQNPFSNLRFRFLGPDGNRACAVVGEPGNPNVSYVGAASGGIFKTSNAGVSWQPVFDDMDNSAIGALAISESNPKQVWAGTGETFIIRPAHPNGNGIYKSTDAGKTWKNMGLKNTVRISKVLVSPTDSNTVYVAALGHTGGPQQERGVYKTTDGGVTWNRVLFVDENTGCSDISINPKDPNNLVAAMWQVQMNTWNLNSGGPGSGFYKTTDGGKTWKQMTNGLPGGPNKIIGKTSIDIAASNPNTIYALVEAQAPGLYKSTDGGESWKLMLENHSLAQRGPYYTRVRVSSQDENKLYTISVTIMESRDGGKTFNGNGSYAPGGDNHEIWFDPKDANRIMVAHDGCMNMTFNGGRNWKNVNLPIAQMYHVALDEMVPYHIMGNRQDGYSYRTEAISRTGSIPLSSWESVGGCESGFAQADPFDPKIIWSGCYDGGLDVTDTRTGLSHDVRPWPQAGYGVAPADMKYRWHWNFPMALSRHQRGAVYVGSQYVHKTTDGGQTWKVISPDLTTNTKSHQQSSGGIVSDNLMTFDGCTLFAIAESPIKKGMIWVGSNDGQVQLTTNDGASWTNLTANLNLPAWGTISNIDPSNFDAGTAYVTVHFQQQADFKAYLYKTSDFGKHWTNIGQKLPESNSGFVHFVKEDPAQKGLIFVGTDNALYVSPDDGGQWLQLKNNLPPSPVYHLAIQKNFRDLAVATYGRGFYILDDITPIREWSKRLATSKTSLYPLRPAYRFNFKGANHDGGGSVRGENPPYGASINYFLADTLQTAPKVFVLGPLGDTIRTIKGSNLKGVNRVWWDLAHEELKMPSLKTKPKGKDFVKMDATGSRLMYVPDLDIGPGMEPIRVPNGSYQVLLKTDAGIEKQMLQVLQDPNAGSTKEAIAAQYALGKDLRASIKACFDLIAEMEIKRAALLKENSAKSLALEQQVYALESKLFDTHQTGARWDEFRNPVQITERLLAISKESQTYGADFAPTTQQLQMTKNLKDQFKAILTDYQQLKKDLP